MKASFRAEYIGFQPSEEARFRQIGALREMERRNRPWVAELTGLDELGQFQRRFVTAKRDFRTANSRGSRGVWCFWTLDAGGLYETRYRTSWNDWHHRFLAVNEHGEIVDVTEQKAREWLRNTTSG